MQLALGHVYDMEGTDIVDGRFRTLRDIMKEVARIVHIKPHTVADVHQRLLDVREGNYSPYEHSTTS